jgi:hypothetical protein
MRQFCQVQGVMHLALRRLLHPDQGHARYLAARIELECQWLDHALFHAAIHEPKDKWGASMHHRAVSLQQQPRAFL